MVVGSCRSAALVAICALIAGVAPVWAQMPEAEHQSHHPAPAPSVGAAAPAAPGASPASTTTTARMGSGMGNMCAMCMDKMAGVPPPTELHPLLMALPDLSPEQREHAAQQAAGWMKAGTALMDQALGELSQGAEANDHGTMELAAAKLREGIGQLETGIATGRALSDGRAPREIALQWFKREMNLPAAMVLKPDNRFGSMRLHYTLIVLLAAIAGTLIVLYSLKLRRASALLASLDGGPGASTAQTALRAALPPAIAAPAAAAPAATAPRRWKGTLRVSRIFQETPTVRTFRLVPADSGPLPFDYQPGQFLTVATMLDGRRIQRSYTIASSPTQRYYCELTIKRDEAGSVSRYLHDGLQEGELLEASGPNGAFVFTGKEADSIVLIGGGVGITPLMSVLRYLTDTGWGGEIFLLYACPTPKEIIFHEELERLAARHPKLRLVITVTRKVPDGWRGRTGYLSKEMIAESVPGIAARRIHICGPERMMRAVQATLIELRVPAANVKTESFTATLKEPVKAGPAAATPALPEPAAEAPATPPQGTAKVTFQKSGKTAPLSPDTSVLEASEDVGVNIPYQCRAGICGTCKVRLVTGDVTMEVQEALTEEDKAAGIVLACQAKSTGDCTVEA